LVSFFLPRNQRKIQACPTSIDLLFIQKNSEIFSFCIMRSKQQFDYGSAQLDTKRFRFLADDQPDNH
jgi:hypothetical protein